MNNKRYENFAALPSCDITDVYVSFLQDVNFILLDQKVYSWGTTNTMNLQGRTTAATTPTIISGLPPVTSFAGFGNIMFAVTTTGDVYGWGTNADNLLTSTSVSSIAAPIKIQGLSNIRKVSVCLAESNPSNSNALKLYICALDTNGSIYMWGHNLLGQFGPLNSSITLQKTPIKIDIPFAVNTIKCINPGVLLIDATGKLFSTNNKILSNTSNITNTNAIDLNMSNVKQVDGTLFMIVLKNDGTVYGFGSNNTYQLGLGNNINVTGSTFSKINLTNVSKIYCDLFNTYFILTNGDLYVCGRNRKLINNPKTNITVPEKLGISNVTAMASGKLALTTGPFNLAVLNNTEVINFGGIDFPNTTASVAFTSVPIANVICSASASVAASASASFVPASTYASFAPVSASPPTTQQPAPNCTGSSASLLPYCASASISSSYASYNSSSQIPSTFEKAMTFRSLLNKEESKKREKVVEQGKNPIQVIHKKTIIQVPPKEKSRCDVQEYNPQKSYGANLIDWVVCSVEDFVKRISKFF